MATLTFGKYTVQPDATGWMVVETKTRQSGDKAGEDYTTALGYFARLPDALDKVLEYRLRESDATDARGLAAEIRAFRAELEPLFRVEVGA
jgi:hypothetical protein